MTATTLSARAARRANRKATHKNPNGLLAAEAEAMNTADTKAVREDLDPVEAREAFEDGADHDEPVQETPEEDVLAMDTSEYLNEQKAPEANGTDTITAEVRDLDATDTMLVKRLSPRELRSMEKPYLAALKERIMKADYRFGTVRGDSPISVMRRILAGTPSLTMKPKDLKEALAKAGYPDTPMSTVNATLAGWAGDVRALRAAGRIVEQH